MRGADKLLLAVSGGADSMCTLFLLHQLGYDIEVAHANFGLRGAESDDDEAFVRQQSELLKVPCHVRRFKLGDVESGIQETARNLRYAWFDELFQNGTFRYVVTGHNATDQVETVLWNQIRGTGLTGFTGIPPKRGIFIRPMLSFTSEEIRTFMVSNQLPFRNDSSNASDKYTRNYIRHHILPTIQQLEPNIEERINSNAEQVVQWLELYQHALNILIQPHVNQEDNGHFSISMSGIQSFPQPQLALYAILNTHGLSIPNCREMLKNPVAGNRYEFGEVEISTMQDRWHISLHRASWMPIEIVEEGEFIIREYVMRLEIVEGGLDQLIADASIAQFDLSLVDLPLTIRPWRTGDALQPLGFNGTKLLSDIFNEQKVPVHKRNQIPVVEQDGRILWVAGYRQSEFGKLSLSTKRILTLSIRSGT